MLITCPECELQVSDKAFTCPHCGYPMKENTAAVKRRRSNKRRRLPNGFGQISEIKNRNLRKPFRAMVTVGKTDEGRPICKPLKPDSYFETYNDAYAALLEYNRNPCDLSKSITVKELYEKWFEAHSKTISKGRITGINIAWRYCGKVYNMQVSDVRPRHIKMCMEEGVWIAPDGTEKHPTATDKVNIKSIFNMMLDYAFEYEIVNTNYAKGFSIDGEIIKEATTRQTEHIPFTDEEMNILWNNSGKIEIVDIMLIQCYTGFRPKELENIMLDDIDLDKWTITGGVKTDAGMNRIVPIHSRIRNLVVQKYNEAVKYGDNHLFSLMRKSGTSRIPFTYVMYRDRLKSVCSELGLNPEHRPHDPRKHFVTMAKKYKMDEYALKRIVGHEITDITERVYTERPLEWYFEEIEKIR